MIFSGCNFCADGSHTFEKVSTSFIGTVGIGNGEFDSLIAVNDSEQDYESNLPVWGENTVLRTDFISEGGKSPCDASNLSYEVNNVDYLVLKRRENEKAEWLEIHRQYINGNVSNFNMSFKDVFNRTNRKYQYILVPVLGGIEGNYVNQNMTEFVKSTIDGICIADNEKIYMVELNPKYTRQRNRESEKVTTLSSKYAYEYSNGSANYDSGSVSGIFVEAGECIDTFNFEFGVDYRNEFYDWLTDGNPKILKTYDGISMIVAIENAPSEQAEDGFSHIPTTTFEWVEIGNPDSYDDLYSNGFIEVN